MADQNFSGIFLTKRDRIHLTLSKECVSWEVENLQKPQTVIPLRNLIAVTPCGCPVKTRTKSLECYYCRFVELRNTCAANGLLSVPAKFMRMHYAVPFGRHQWRLKTQILHPLESSNLQKWIDTLQYAIAEFNRPKRLLIFINPYGGKKKAMKVFEKKVLPILHLARIEAHSVVTQRANHAKEMIEDIDILKYDGIICVGGDGMFSEVLNAVVLKTQQEKGIDPDDIYNPLIVPRISLGIIPAGSTNAAVHCITGSSDPLSATLLIVMGDLVGIDVCGVYSSGQFLRYCVTFLSYGYFGDLIRHSEKLRWMGPKRYDYSGLKNILNHKLYEGELQLQVDVPTNASFVKDDKCCVACETCINATQISCAGAENTMEKKNKWLTVKGRFIAVNAAVMSCACAKSSKGISASQHLGNGYCDVILISSCSRLSFLQYLLRTALHHSDPFDLNFVDVYRVREFRFNPFMSDDKTPSIGCAGVRDAWQQLNTSIWNCDGEMITEPTVTAKVHNQLVNVFGRGYEDRKRKSRWTECFRFLKRT